MKASRKLLIVVAILTALATVGVSYAAVTWKTPVNIVTTNYYNDPFSWVVSNDDGSVQNVSPYGDIDPGDDGTDPYVPQSLGVPTSRYTKDVASTTATLTDFIDGYYHGITATISNAYPFYYPTIFFGLLNAGSVAGRVCAIEIDENYTGDTDTTLDDIIDLEVTLNGISLDQIIGSGKEAVGRLSIRVNQEARQNWEYRIRIKIKTCVQEFGGTPGFWKNWRNRYTQQKMVDWLTQIDAGDYDGVVSGSKWLGPTTVAGLDQIFIDYNNSSKNKFIGQYLCTRLNMVSGRLNPYNTHDITGIDGYDFLGLPNANNAQLWQIISAIEAKYGSLNGNNKQDSRKFEIMKNILDAINNTDI